MWDVFQQIVLKQIFPDCAKQYCKSIGARLWFKENPPLNDPLSTGAPSQPHQKQEDRHGEPIETAQGCRSINLEEFKTKLMYLEWDADRFIAQFKQTGLTREDLRMIHDPRATVLLGLCMEEGIQGRIDFGCAFLQYLTVEHAKRFE
jgi:hypothetical protein